MSCQHCASFRLLAAVLCVLALPATARAAQVDSDDTYSFCCADFAGDSQSSLAGVYITGLPEASQGTVRLGDRAIRAGDVLTVGQLAQMTFAPAATQADTAALVRYLPVYSDHIAPEATVTISIRGKEDKPPVAEDSALETYKNLPNEGLLKVTDPEEQVLTYTLVRSPKRGEVILREDGSFLYTPSKNKVGTDSFTYTASDPAGNVSREATVTVKILKPTDSTQYTDTLGQSCRFAAEWMRNTGIFSGETISGQACFCPEETVSRGQFLSMLMEVLELPVDHSVTYTGFLDEAESWLKPYLAAALRSGIISGYPSQGGVEFRPDQAITGQEATTMLRNALDYAVPTAALDVDSSAPVELTLEEGPLTRADAAQTLYSLNCLLEERGFFSGLLH